MTDSEAVPSEIVDELRSILAEAGISDNKKLVRQILEAGIGLGTDHAGRLDLKIASAALTEMRAAFRLFAPFSRTPKVTIFGSARAKPDSPAYQQTRKVSAALAEQGWMVVTGAGPGIMQAAVEGAGAQNSLGVSIRLPFEERPNSSIEGSRNVAMKYFFTRKLMLVKESHGFVYVPGGFGTLDELFELLTLQQTGKSEPTPIVLLDEPGGRLWHGLRAFAQEQLLPAGVISPDDFDRVLLTDSVTAAADEITGFWRNYHSLRWAGDRLVLRLRAEPTEAEIAGLDERFGDLLTSGGFRSRGPLHREIKEDDHTDLPRLVCHFDPFKVGSLYRLIRALNALDSAPDDGHPEQLH